jgi:hypothetical protein
MDQIRNIRDVVLLYKIKHNLPDSSDSENSGTESDSNSDSDMPEIYEEIPNNPSNYICDHYYNYSNIYTPCCDKIYSCIKCHNINADHEINIKEIKHLVCKICDRKQQISDTCKYCSTKFGQYSCIYCLVFENNINIFSHCDKCNKCVSHKNITNLLHCNTCSYCLPKEHKCRNNIDLDCCICLEQIDKKTNSIQLRCSHIFHELCFESYKKVKCPLCSKTTTDVQLEYHDLDKDILNTPIPEELKELTIIYCNDCENKSSAIYHYKGIKCSICSSYNTHKY